MNVIHRHGGLATSCWAYHVSKLIDAHGESLESFRVECVVFLDSFQVLSEDFLPGYFFILVFERFA